MCQKFRSRRTDCSHLQIIESERGLNELTRLPLEIGSSQVFKDFDRCRLGVQPSDTTSCRNRFILAELFHNQLFDAT